LLELSVRNPVWKSFSANPDTLKYTIAGELVHDQRRFNFSGFLVSIRHQATNKVRFAGMKSGHQFSQRHQIDRGDSLATTSLLFLLFSVCSNLLFRVYQGLTRVITPQEY
jgi:hypothetical protein